VVLVGTVRRDGRPRISPVEPLLWRDDLWLSMLHGSYKARDLERDPRVLVHSIVTSREGTLGEFKVDGQAVAVSDEQTQADYAAEVSRQLGWSPVAGHFHLFRIEIDLVAYLRYDHTTGDQFSTLWPPGEEFVRRGKGATEVGEREAWHELLD